MKHNLPKLVEEKAEREGRKLRKDGQPSISKAEISRESDVARPVIIYWYQNEDLDRVNIEVAYKLSRYLGCSLDELLLGDVAALASEEIEAAK